VGSKKLQLPNQFPKLTVTGSKPVQCAIESKSYHLTNYTVVNLYGEWRAQPPALAGCPLAGRIRFTYYLAPRRARYTLMHRDLCRCVSGAVIDWSQPEPFRSVFFRQGDRRLYRTPRLTRVAFQTAYDAVQLRSPEGQEHLLDHPKRCRPIDWHGAYQPKVCCNWGSICIAGGVTSINI